MFLIHAICKQCLIKAQQLKNTFIFLICKCSDWKHHRGARPFQAPTNILPNLPTVADGSPVPSSSWMWPRWPDRSITGIAAHLKGFLNDWGCCGGKASAPVDSRVSSVSTALIHTLTDAGFSLALAALVDPSRRMYLNGCWPHFHETFLRCTRVCFVVAQLLQRSSLCSGEGYLQGYPCVFGVRPHYRATSAQRLMLHS